MNEPRLGTARAWHVPGCNCPEGAITCSLDPSGFVREVRKEASLSLPRQNRSERRRLASISRKKRA